MEKSFLHEKCFLAYTVACQPTKRGILVIVKRYDIILIFLFPCLMLQICPFWKIPSLVGQVVVAMVIVTNSVIGGLS